MKRRLRLPVASEHASLAAIGRKYAPPVNARMELAIRIVHHGIAWPVSARQKGGRLVSPRQVWVHHILLVQGFPRLLLGG